MESLELLFLCCWQMTAHLEPQTQQFIQTLDALGGPPIYELTPMAAREVLDSLQAQSDYNIPAQIEDLLLPRSTSIRIVRPATYVTGLLPVVIYCHGGGWILGNYHTHDRLIRELANGTNCAIVFVNYTPSPEAQFPTAIEEVYAVTRYIALYGHSMQLDPSRLAIAGDSVGGNMATAVTMVSIRKGGPYIKFQLLLYPVTDADFQTRSYQQFANGPWLTRKAMQWYWDNYEPNLETRKDPLVSPLQASLDELSRMPATLIITDENDVLRDEGEAYAHKLMQAGVSVTSLRCIGTIHDFMMLNALASTPATRLAIQTAITYLQYHLHT